MSLRENFRINSFTVEAATNSMPWGMRVVAFRSGVASTFTLRYGTISDMRWNVRDFFRYLKCGRNQRVLDWIFRSMLVLTLAFPANGLRAQSAKEAPLGIAWDVQGVWHEGAGREAIRTGDAVQPGEFLQPAPSASDHSITILLPDGQRILYECFTAVDCARGFRVPSLYMRPDGFAADMLARIRLVMQQDRASESNIHTRSRLPQDEAIAQLRAGNQAEAGGLAAALQNGRYTYEVRAISPARPLQTGLTLEKTSSVVTFLVPGPGLYDVTIADTLKRPRIDLLVAAIRPSQNETVMKPFEKAQARLADWNENYQGWPIHDFQRAYLESLMLGMKPLSEPRTVATEAPRSGVAAEPQFSPKPGVFKGDTSVTLQSVASGAEIHYTVDGSQPFLSSPVYRAPIMVKGTELTVKAFASAPGKKDSAVVTGIFRIEQ